MLEMEVRSTHIHAVQPYMHGMQEEPLIAFAIDNFQDADFNFFICFPKYSTSNFNKNTY